MRSLKNSDSLTFFNGQSMTGRFCFIMALGLFILAPVKGPAAQPMVRETIHKNHPNGKPSSDMSYVNGILEGESIIYREDGSPELTGDFVDGKLEEYQFFDEQGNPLDTEDRSRAEYLFRQALDQVRWED